MSTVLSRIEKYRPCDEARKWLGRRSNIAQAWNTCPDAGWMIWLLGEVHKDGKIDRKWLVLAACAVARTTLHLVSSEDDRPRIAIETAEAWCRGEATIEQVRAAAAAASSAAYAAYAAGYAAYSAGAAGASSYAAASYAASDADATYAADAARPADATRVDAVLSVVPAEVIVTALS